MDEHSQEGERVDGMKRMTCIVIALTAGSAFCVTNLAQIVGRDLTPEVCSGIPDDSSTWESAALATLKFIRLGDATNFWRISTADLLVREFEAASSNGMSEVFASAFRDASAEFSHYMPMSYSVVTNTKNRVSLDLPTLLKRGESTSGITELFHFSLISTDSGWRLDDM